VLAGPRKRSTASAFAGTSGITFSEFPSGTAISTQYENLGIIFSGTGPRIADDGANPSSPVLSPGSNFQGSLTGQFVLGGTTRPGLVDSFSLDVGYIDSPGSTTVTIYDGDGNVLGTVTPTVKGITTVTSSFTGAGSFTVSGSDPAGWAIDNVSFAAPAWSPTVGAPSAATRASSDSALHSPGCDHGPFPVNCASGDFWHTFTDFDIPGRGPQLTVTRTYDSLSASSKGVFGYGWSSNLDAHLTVHPDGSVTVTADDGSQATATSNPDGTYSMPNWSGSTLKRNVDGTWTFVHDPTRTLAFSVTGQLTAITDPNNYSASLSYDAAGNLSALTDASGRSLSIVVGADGLISSITDPAGDAENYGYNAAGELTSATDADTRQTLFTYDPGHLLKTMTDPRGGVVTNVYDPSGRVTSQTDPANRTTNYAYTGDNFSAAGGSTSITDPLGHVELQQYQLGQLLSVTKASGTSAAQTWFFEYDQTTFGRTATTDPDGRTTTAGYDVAGNQTSSVDGSGSITTSQYNKFNELTSKTDALQHTVTYAYDASGNLKSISRPLTETGQTQTTAYTYGDASHPGDVTAITDPCGNTTQISYDAHGDRASVTDAAGDQTTYAYDGVGQLLRSVSPRGNVTGADPTAFTTSYTYDARGNRLTMTDPLGHTTMWTYDGNDDIATIKDANNRITQYTYNADGQLLTAQRPDTSTTTYTYDDDGNRTKITDALQHATQFGFDSLDRRTSKTDALGRTTSYAYDGAGDRTSASDPNGAATAYSYDGARRLIKISYPDGTPDTTYSYDAAGRRTSMTDATGTTSFTYDSISRLTSQTNAAGQRVSYGYDLGDNVTSLTYPNGKSVTRSYDPANRLSAVTDWLGNITSYNYDRDSKTSSESYPNGVVATSSYDNADQLSEITDQRGASTLADFRYGRNNLGQVTSDTPTGLGQATTYGYDALNRLTSEGASGYSYDATNNVTALASGASLSYDAAGQLVSMTSGTQTSTLTYDARGNRLRGGVPGGTSPGYGYNAANELTGYSAAPPTSNKMISSNGSVVALRPDGTVWTWGLGTSGQLGNGTTTSSSVPVQVSGLSSVTAVSEGGDFALALKSDGTVWAWGYNFAGQLGNNTTTNSSVPVQVATLSNITAIAAGGSHSMALKSDGTVWCWGSNSNGQLGNNSTRNSSVPVQVGKFTGVSAVAAGGNDSLALKSDGTAWDWGANASGQLGNNTTRDAKIPTQIPGLSSVAALYAGGAFSIARKTDGTILAWGVNTYGQLGTGTRTNSLVPVQANITGVAKISAGADFVMALRNDGGLWVWGHDDYGQLGNGATGVYPTPAQSSLTNVAAFAAGAQEAFAVQADGTTWGMGRNVNGNLGNGTTTDSHVPTRSNFSIADDQYTYDGDGLRATRLNSGSSTNFAWDRSANIPLVLTDGSTSYVYGVGGAPIEQIAADSSVLYLGQDQLASTRLISDASAAVVGTYSYSAYGATTAHTGTVTTALQFGGQYHDADSGLYYLRARYYDPATAAFLTRDPLEGLTTQPYSYANDDPVNGNDPTGDVCTTLQCVIDDLGTTSTVAGGVVVLSLVLMNFEFTVPYVWTIAATGTVANDVSVTAGFAFAIGKCSDDPTSAACAEAVAAALAGAGAVHVFDAVYKEILPEAGFLAGKALDTLLTGLSKVRDSLCEENA
jgi:RHS repeat-associated protein